MLIRMHCVEGSVKVNLGCGPIGKDDWINVDYGMLALLGKYPLLKRISVGLRIFPKDYAKWEWPKNLVIHDCRKELPFKDGTVDYVYTSHLIEHFPKYDAIRMLKECLRVLKFGGYIRVVLPDLELLARKYVERDYDFFIGNPPMSGFQDACLSDLFLSHFYPKKNREPINSLLGKLHDKFTRWHLWHYDFDSLGFILRDCGFFEIERRKYREGNVPDIEFLDRFPNESLFVEATKPREKLESSKEK